MPEQNFLAPGPKQSEFNTLNSTVTSLSEHIGTLPNPTSINSMNELKTHLLSIHNSIANNGIQTSHIDIASGFADGYFVASSRYVGTYKRSTANQGVIEYSSPNKGDTVTVGLYSVSTTPTLNIFSPYYSFATARGTGGDLNNCKSPGFYTAGPSTSHIPASGYYTVLIMPFSANDLAQLAVDVNNAKTYVRTFHDGTTWTSWKTIVS